MSIPQRYWRGTVLITRYWRKPLEEDPSGAPRPATDTYVVPAMFRGGDFNVPCGTFPTWTGGADYSAGGMYLSANYAISDPADGAAAVDTKLMIHNLSDDHESSVYAFMYNADGNPCGSVSITVPARRPVHPGQNDTGPRYRELSVLTAVREWLAGVAPGSAR